MECSPLQGDSVMTEGVVRTASRLSSTGAWSRSMAAPGFTWRSGDDVADGGHTVAPSIGQVILSLTKLAVVSASERSGKVHIVPIT